MGGAGFLGKIMTAELNKRGQDEIVELLREHGAEE